MKRYKAFIFDLDGTLLDTLADIADSANEVLGQKGFPIYTVEEYKTLVGRGFRQLFTNALPQETSDKKIDECCALFKQIYQENWNNRSKAYPQIPAMLEELKNQGCRLAVLSNKQDRYTKQCVDYFFAEDLFDYAFGERERVAKKPDPQGIFQISALLDIPLNQTCFVGDSGIDMQAGNNAGIFTVGVSWGYRTVEELKENKADAIISEPMELLKYAGTK